MLGEKLRIKIAKVVLNWVFYSFAFAAFWHIVAPERLHWMVRWQLNWSIAIAIVYLVTLTVAVKLADKLPALTKDGKE